MRYGRSTTPVAGPIITLLDSPDFVELVHDRTHLHPANYRNVVRPPVDQFGSFEGGVIYLTSLRKASRKTSTCPSSSGPTLKDMQIEPRAERWALKAS